LKKITGDAKFTILLESHTIFECLLYRYEEQLDVERQRNEQDRAKWIHERQRRLEKEKQLKNALKKTKAKLEKILEKGYFEEDDNIEDEIIISDDEDNNNDDWLRSSNGSTNSLLSRIPERTMSISFEEGHLEPNSWTSLLRSLSKVEIKHLAMGERKRAISSLPRPLSQKIDTDSEGERESDYGTSPPKFDASQKSLNVIEQGKLVWTCLTLLRPG
jgi:hypothetical protein